jgi:hypothetical protein
VKKPFNNQFATQKLRAETSMTNVGGATFTPGTGEQMATNKAFKKKPKKEVKDVEPKLAAGKAKIYMKDKWGWKDAPSVPNRPSKGGFIYKQLFEGLEVDDRVKVVYGNEFYGETGTVVDIIKGFAVVEMDRDGKEYSMHVSDVEKIEDEDIDEVFTQQDYDKVKVVLSKIRDKNQKLYNAIIDALSDVYPHDLDQEFGADIKAAGLNENYSRFKTETKTRGKSDQFHQAIRAVRQKVQEINRLFEYVSRLKQELSEAEGGLKYKMHTEKALAKIKDMVNELNKNVKKFK